MQINNIDNNPFKGSITIKNLKNSNNVVRKTTFDLDKGLSDYTLKNIFNGCWKNQGHKRINNNKLITYINIIQQTLGISIPKTQDKITHVELKYFDNGYSIANKDYKITHIREDSLVWE